MVDQIPAARCSRGAPAFEEFRKAVQSRSPYLGLRNSMLKVLAAGADSNIPHCD